MVKPNFLVLGAAKAGTTSLYNYLKQHPQIYLSSHREPNFWGFEGESCNSGGLADEQGSKRYQFLRKISITNRQLYEAQFDGVVKEKAIGEISPLYLYNPRAARRIHQYKPNIKLITILRNPVERAYSHFVYYLTRGQEPIPDFYQAIKQEEVEVKNIWYGHRHYIRLGFYYSQLEPYFQLFPPDSIKIYLYEEFAQNPTAMLQDLCQFLEIEQQFELDTSVKYNQSLVPKNKMLHNLLTHQSPVKNFLKKLLPPQMTQVVQNFNQQNLVKVKPFCSPEARNYLISIYEEDILQLQDLIERDLSDWLGKTKVTDS